jgi:hypothetical protein
MDGVVLNRRPATQASFKYYEYYSKVESEKKQDKPVSLSHLKPRWFHRPKQEGVVNDR